MSKPAEQIVRALAAKDTYIYGLDGCALCGSDARDSHADHEPDCPWRLAVEWATAQDDPSQPVTAWHVALHLVFTDKHGHGFTDSGRSTVQARSAGEALLLAALDVEVPEGHTVSGMPYVWQPATQG